MLVAIFYWLKEKEDLDAFWLEQVQDCLLRPRENWIWDCETQLDLSWLYSSLWSLSAYNQPGWEFQHSGF